MARGHSKGVWQCEEATDMEEETHETLIKNKWLIKIKHNGV